MNNNATLLIYRAKALMPASISAHDCGDMLVSLLFWKMISDWWRSGAPRWWQAYSGANPACVAMEQQNTLLCIDAAIYEACQWPHDSETNEAIEAGKAIRSSLYALARAQVNPLAMIAMLRPERFGRLGEFAELFRLCNTLPRVIDIIGGISSIPPELMGKTVIDLVGTLEMYPPWPTARSVKLMAKLLNPLRGETVLDPACGSGQLLLALVADIERHERDHELVLLGQENRTSQWAITKMQLLLRALMLHRVDKSDAMDSPLLDSATEQLQQADVVVLAVPDEAQEWNPASHAQDARFPEGVPEDSRIALIWHALACMKMDSGRLGLLVSGSLLTLDASLPLRRHLVENQLLEAIIQLPPMRRQAVQRARWLLLIRPAQPTVALIGKPLPQNPADKNKNTYCTDDIEAAWNDLRMCRTHPCLQTVSGATIAAQGYQFIPPAIPEPADPATPCQKAKP
jgi:hypothetical protein